MFKSMTCKHITGNDIDQIPTGDPLGPKTMLIRGKGRSRVYLVIDGVKRWIENPKTFNAMEFDWKKIKNVNPEVVDHLKTGKSIRVD